MNNDELQKAIDDITSSDVVAPVSPAPVNNGVTDENEQLINEFGGDKPAQPAASVAEQVAAELNDMPVPPSPVEPIAPEPEKSVDEPVMSVELEQPVAANEPMAAEPEVPDFSATTGEVTAAAANDVVDLEEVKKNALLELYPLLKNMNINPEQAYDICKQVAEMGEKDALKEAFEVAKKISDDTTRANALFEIVEMIEK